MKAVYFKESNIELKKPDSLTDKECSSLHIHTNGEQCISLWRLSFKERLKVLFSGKVWLWVWSGKTQPPVLLQTESPFKSC